MRTRTLTVRALAATALVVAAGCQDIIDGVQSDYVAMAALVKTPDIAVPAPTQQDPLATRIEPGRTLATVFFGKADRDKIVNNQAAEGAFTPLAGAVVKLQFTDANGTAQDLGLTDEGEGKYLLDSTNAAALTYVSGADYTLSITHQLQTFKLKTKAPAVIEIEEFRNQTPIPKARFAHTPGSAFTITRYETTAPGPTEKRPVAFWGVQSPNGSGTSLGFDSIFAASNVPTDALPVLQFLLNDGPWREKTFQVAGSTFAADSDYLMVMGAIERGGDSGGAGDGTLFPASSFLVGSADGGVVSTKPAPMPEIPQP